MGHSMGNRVVQYFFHWLRNRNQDPWIKRNIHAFLAMGPPFLGSSKAVRTVLTGDTMGLEVFLTEKEALFLVRKAASLPWLFPVLEDSAYPDTIIRQSTKKTYKEMTFQESLMKCIPRTYAFYEEFYLRNPFILAKLPGTPIPILAAPPTRVWSLYGINRQTEVGYYLRSGKFALDAGADKYSGKVNAAINPRGLLIQGGTSFETSTTFQPTLKEWKSGDGTVPYCSLSYAETWWADVTHVYTVEIEDAEHREMLDNELVFHHIIDFVCCLPH